MPNAVDWKDDQTAEGREDKRTKERLSERSSPFNAVIWMPRAGIE